jgi:hypothetical protein
VFFRPATGQDAWRKRQTSPLSRPVDESKFDPDCRKILDTFRPLQKLLQKTPRADMEGFVEPPCSVPAVSPKVVRVLDNPAP